MALTYNSTYTRRVTLDQKEYEDSAWLEPAALSVETMQGACRKMAATPHQQGLLFAWIGRTTEYTLSTDPAPATISDIG